MHPTSTPNTDPARDSWSWLRPGVLPRDVLAMFEEIYLFSSTFAWFTLTGQEVVRARLGGETVHLRLATRLEGPGRLRLALHLARDEETLAAWHEGLLGETEIVVTAVWRSELSRAALAEWVLLGRERRELFPRVTVGLARREPDVAEWALALRALEAFNLLHEPLCGGAEGVQIRTLQSGEEVELEVMPPSLPSFPINDGGGHDLAGRFDRSGPSFDTRGVLAASHVS